MQGLASVTHTVSLELLRHSSTVSRSEQFEGNALKRTESNPIAAPLRIVVACLLAARVDQEGGVITGGRCGSGGARVTARTTGTPKGLVGLYRIPGLFPTRSIRSLSVILNPLDPVTTEIRY